jgi:hypothetical protein
MLITGVGMGFALPTLVGAAAAALPPHRFATGSAVTTMARRTGALLGVALMVTLLGEPGTADAALTAFRHGWVAAVAALALRKPAAAGIPDGAPVAVRPRSVVPDLPDLPDR